MDSYANARERVAAALETWKTGTVTLSRTAFGDPDPATPWLHGAPTVDVYTLDAKVDGVVAAQIDGTTVLATDLVVIASPRARHTSSDGEPADGAVVEIEPQMTDQISVDGRPRVVKRVVAYPAAGAAALFHIFVAS